ncbi:hypothetical protein KKG71_04060 [Patescibacteria group bacterium]|nr:hypothetical protein [Patescibacteria group bacterium]
MHRILIRQLKKYIEDPNSISGEWQEFIKAVDGAYRNADDDRILAERSLEISSKEMSVINEKLKKEVIESEAKAEKLREMNSFLVNRELKMIELKERIKELECVISDLNNK